MHTRVILAILAFFTVCMTPGCAPKAEEPQKKAVVKFNASALSGEKALERTAAFVALGRRESGSRGAVRAADYISGQLRELGIETQVDEFEDTTPNGKSTFRNVVGRIPGRGEGIIILVSHYDTKKGISRKFVGANDSGSSTGLLLELASVLGRGPVAGPEIQLAFVDGEECTKHYGAIDGLHGSRHMAECLKEAGVVGDVKAVIVLDMVGDRDLNITVPRNSSRLLIASLFKAAEKAGKREFFSLYGRAIIDDHVPFAEAGMPVIDIIDFEYGSRAGLNDYWHSTEDTMEKLSAASLETVGQVTIGFLNLLLAE